MTILISGSTGTIGSAIIEQLASHADVRALVRGGKTPSLPAGAGTRRRLGRVRTSR